MGAVTLWSTRPWNDTQGYIWLSENSGCDQTHGTHLKWKPSRHVFGVPAHLWGRPPPTPGFTHCAGVCFATHDLRVFTKRRMKSSCHGNSNYRCCWCAFGLSNHAKLWREWIHWCLKTTEHFVFLLPEQVKAGTSATGWDNDHRRKSKSFIVWLQHHQMFFLN